MTTPRRRAAPRYADNGRPRPRASSPEAFHHMREDAFVALAPFDGFLGVPRCLGAALQCHPSVVFPEVLLPGHALDGGALLLPDAVDAEQHVRLPVALLRLMRLEQENRRCAEHRLARLVTMRLGGDAGVL